MKPCQTCGYDGDGLHNCTDWLADEAKSLRRKLAAAAKFKAFVHGRLDQAGIPPDPGGPHSLEGCRIGDRLDLVFAERDKLKSAIERYIRTTRRMVAPFAQQGRAGLEACSDQHDAAYQDLLAAAGIPPMRREDL